MVSIPVCHTGDRGSIPRQRELLEPNTRPHQVTFSTFDLSKFKPEKTWRMTRKNESGNDTQPNMSLSKVVSISVCHTGDRDSIPRQRELLEPNTRFYQITVPTLDVSKIKPEKTRRMTVKKTKVEMIISPTCLLV